MYNVLILYESRIEYVYLLNFRNNQKFHKLAFCLGMMTPLYCQIYTPCVLNVATLDKNNNKFQNIHQGHFILVQ